MFIELVENNPQNRKVSVALDFIGSVRDSQDGCSEICTKDGTARKYKIEYIDLLEKIKEYAHPSMLKKIISIFKKENPMEEVDMHQQILDFLAKAYINEDGVIELTAAQRLTMLHQRKAIPQLDGTILYGDILCK